MLYYNKSGAGNPVTTSEIARPFKVEAASLYPVFVEFASVNMQENSRRSEKTKQYRYKFSIDASECVFLLNLFAVIIIRRPINKAAT